jgi:hypothetical protein
MLIPPLSSSKIGEPPMKRRQNQQKEAICWRENCYFKINNTNGKGMGLSHRRCGFTLVEIMIVAANYCASGGDLRAEFSAGAQTLASHARARGLATSRSRNRSIRDRDEQIFRNASRLQRPPSLSKEK